MKYYLYNSLSNNGIKPEVGSGVELIDAVGIYSRASQINYGQA